MITPSEGVLAMQKVERWGVTGWSNEWTSLEAGDDDVVGSEFGFGIHRVVEPGVVFIKPPVVGEWSGWTETPGKHQRCYQMPWFEDEQPAPLTLIDMYEQLTPRRAALESGDEQLRHLDASILDAVRQVDRLHRAGGSLGFVQPDSIVFCRMRDGSSRVVFPDVGFAWDEGRALREPKWIVDPQLDCLFEEGARRHNAACLAAFREAELLCGGGGGRPQAKDRASALVAGAQATDVRMLARLIAVALVGPDQVQRWCGEGRAFLSVPGRDRAPDTQAPVWDQVVAPALLGKIATAAGLLEKLQLSPPSEHYLFKPPTPPPVWKVAFRRALPGLVGAAAIITILTVARPVFERLFPRRDPHPLCNTVYAGDVRFSLLDEVEEARGRAQAGDLESVAGYWELLSRTAELPPACLGTLRAEAAEMISTQALSIPARLRDEPITRSKQIALLQRAFQVAAAAEQISPGSCQRVIDLLRRQLQARGEVPRQAPSVPSGGGAIREPAVEAEPSTSHRLAVPPSFSVDIT